MSTVTLTITTSDTVSHGGRTYVRHREPRSFPARGISVRSVISAAAACRRRPAEGHGRGSNAHVPAEKPLRCVEAS
jgi:hypothetical protein